MKPTRYFSNRQEKAIAKKTGGRRQINSGATALYKGDVTADGMLIEAKTCMNDKKSFSIQKEWLDKVKKECYESRMQYYSLAFNFGPGQPNYYIVDESTFMLLMEKIKETNK